MLDIANGEDNFRTLREKNCLYVDKTPFVRELLSNKSPVLLMPRPRRFGKTLNMTMLHSFFDMTQDSKSLFDGLAITADADAMTHLNAYPTIFLSLKALAFSTWAGGLEELGRQIAKIIEKHAVLLKPEQLPTVDRETLRALRNKEASPNTLAISLNLLCDVLYQSTGKKTILLIDEYDAPIHAGLEKGYFEDVVSFFRVFLGEALKGNPYLERAVLTGILRVAKESIFSGLNNLEVHTILDTPFSTYFGFTEAEVEALMVQCASPHPMSEVRAWYNGYCFGQTTIYNPWSILNMLKRGAAGLASHWLNTSGNGLIRDQIQKGGCNLGQLETLMRGGRIHAKLSSSLVLRDMSPEVTWSLFLFAGYLTAENYNENEETADLYIPNFEVHRFFRDTVRTWLGPDVHSNKLIAKLLEGKMDDFLECLQETVVTILSYYDTAAKQPEKIFHVFILGLLAHLADRYRVVSNRETGHGRADLQLIPRQPGQAGFVFEFKAAPSPAAQSLRVAASEALDQAACRDYPAMLRQEPISSLTTIGLASHGKRLALVHIVQTLPDGPPSERTYLLAGPEPEQESGSPALDSGRAPSKPRKTSSKARKKGEEVDPARAIQLQLLQQGRGLPVTPLEVLVGFSPDQMERMIQALTV